MKKVLAVDPNRQLKRFLEYIDNSFMDFAELYQEILSVVRDNKVKKSDVFEKIREFMDVIEVFVGKLSQEKGIPNTFVLPRGELNDIERNGEKISERDCKNGLLSFLARTFDYLEEVVYEENEEKLVEFAHNMDKSQGSIVLNLELSEGFMVAKIMKDERRMHVVLDEISRIHDNDLFDPQMREDVVLHLFRRGFKREFLTCLSICPELMGSSRIAIKAILIYLKDGAEGKESNGFQKAYDQAFKFYDHKDPHSHSSEVLFLAGLAAANAKNPFLYLFLKSIMKEPKTADSNLITSRESSITVGYNFGVGSPTTEMIEGLQKNQQLICQLYGVDALINARRFNVYNTYKFESQINEKNDGVCITIREKDGRTGKVKELGAFDVRLSRSLDLVFLNVIKVILNKKAKSIKINEGLATQLKECTECIESFYPIYNLEEERAKIDKKVVEPKEELVKESPAAISKKNIEVIGGAGVSLEKVAIEEEDDYSFRDILDILKAGGKQLAALFRELNLELDRVKGSHHIFKTPEGDTVLMSGSKAKGTQQKVAKQLHAIRQSDQNEKKAEEVKDQIEEASVKAKKPRRRRGRGRRRATTAK